LREQINENFLSKYDLTIEEFRKKGKKQFGNDFEVMNKPIREFHLGTSLLACGVDTSDFPHIFTVRPPSGSVRVNDSLGHTAIGTGAEMALGALGARSLETPSIEDFAFRVLEAKFVAETAPGVGKSSLFVMLRRGLDHPMYLPADNPLREAYAQRMLQPAPLEARDFIRDSFKTAGLF
jgi:hypothetical protein